MIQALEAYTADQRAEAVQRAQTALNNLDKRIDDNWNQMNAATCEKARANLEALRKQRNQVAEWYESMINSYSLGEDSILFNNVTIGRHAKIRRAIIEENVTVPDGEEIDYNLKEDQQKSYTVTESEIIVVQRKKKLCQK